MQQLSLLHRNNMLVRRTKINIKININAVCVSLSQKTHVKRCAK